MTAIPQAAVDAAMKSAEAGYGVAAKAAAGQIRYALEAAAPLIAAAERERIAQLAERHAAGADLQAASDEARIAGDVLRNFATLIREDPS